MKRSVLLGLFVTASMMASTSFADNKPTNLCDANIMTLQSAPSPDKPELKQRAEASVTRAQALKKEGRIEDCVAETSQTITELRKTGGNNN